MASGVQLDTSALQAAMQRLLSPQARESLARQMGVAGGRVLRDEAKRNAPVLKAGSVLPGSDREPTPGLLRDSIYLAFKEKMSRGDSFTYGVSWKSKHAAFYGHFIEFGHWRYNTIINGSPSPSLNGQPNKHTSPSGKRHGGAGALEQPKWVPAQPFLRPAFDLVGTVARKAMIERGRIRAAELIQEAKRGT